MDVSIIIVNYNTLKMTQECIDSVFEKTSGLDFEVILVDNGSTDCSREHFSKDSRIRYIYSEKNLGFGRANNIGYAQAKGKYLFLLNSDTYLLNNAIYEIWATLEKANSGAHSNVACAGCMLTDEQGEIIHSYARFPSMWQSIMRVSVHPILWKLHLMKEPQYSSNYSYEEHSREKSFEVEYITGADLMVRKDVADRYGLFDSDFFMYCEETEMQHRYLSKGFKSVIVNGPQIVHLEGKSNRGFSPARKTMVMRSSLLYFKKTSSSWKYQIFALAYKFSYILISILTFPFIHGKSSEKLSHLWNIAML